MQVASEKLYFNTTVVEYCHTNEILPNPACIILFIISNSVLNFHAIGGLPNQLPSLTCNIFSAILNTIKILPNPTCTISNPVLNINAIGELPIPNTESNV